MAQILGFFLPMIGLGLFAVILAWASLTAKYRNRYNPADSWVSLAQEIVFVFTFGFSVGTLILLAMREWLLAVVALVVTTWFLLQVKEIRRVQTEQMAAGIC